MLDRFFAAPAIKLEQDRGAYFLAWRPVGARPLSAALGANVTLRPKVTRPPPPKL